MSIATRVVDYLHQQKIQFDIVNHAHSHSSMGTAIATRINPKRIVKAVILEDHQSRHLMAILPADKIISLHKLDDFLDSSFRLVKEQVLMEMFSDCQQGAIPAFSQAYHLNAIYEEALSKQGDVYLEGGDHQTLIHLHATQFVKLMAKTKHARFSSDMIH